LRSQIPTICGMIYILDICAMCASNAQYKTWTKTLALCSCNACRRGKLCALCGRVYIYQYKHKHSHWV